MTMLWWNIGGILLVLLFCMAWSRTQLKPKSLLSKEKFDINRLDPYPDTKIKGKTKYRITMAMKALDQCNWLTVDKNYKEQHKIRTEFLDKYRTMIVQCLPQAEEACEEALHTITAFLCNRYPDLFEIESSIVGSMVKNKETGETFPVGSFSKGLSPLEIASRLTMEDLTILLKNEEGKHYIGATASFFPIGWSADKVVGDTVSKMHAPVPQWQAQVGNAVNKFLTRLSPETPMERASYFIQVTHPDESLPSILFQPDGIVHRNLNPQPEHIIVRRERQLFTRLPRSGGIIFAVKTSLTPLPDLPHDDLANLVTEMQSWPEDIARYKGREHWGDTVVKFCRVQQDEIEKKNEAAAKYPGIMV